MAWSAFGADTATGVPLPGSTLPAVMLNTYVRDNVLSVYEQLVLSGRIASFGQAIAVSLGAGTSTGSLPTLARVDHTHQSPATYGIQPTLGGSATGLLPSTVINLAAGATATDTGSAIDVTFQLAGGYQIPSFASPVDTAPGDVTAAGVAPTQARADHRHGRTADQLTQSFMTAVYLNENANGPFPVLFNYRLTAPSAGTASGIASNLVARSDHRHGFGSGTQFYAESPAPAVMIGSDPLTMLPLREAFCLAGSSTVTSTGTVTVTPTTGVVDSGTGITRVRYQANSSAVGTSILAFTLLVNGVATSGSRSSISLDAGASSTTITVTDVPASARTDVTITVDTTQFTFPSATTGITATAAGSA